MNWLDRIRAVFAYITTPFVAIISSPVLELFLGIFHAIPVTAMRNGEPPSRWWTIYRYFLVTFHVLTSIRLIINPEFGDKAWQQLSGEVYRFLTKTTRTLSYSSVAFKLPTLAMMIIMNTSQGWQALHLLVPTLNRHRLTPSRRGTRIENALKASVVLVLAWLGIIIYLYGWKFESKQYPAAAISWGTVSSAWITDVFMGLATFCALYLIVIDELDRDVELWLTNGVALITELPDAPYDTPPTLDQTAARTVVANFYRIVRVNRQLNGFVGYFVGSLYTLFVAQSIVLYEIAHGVPTHEIVRVMLVLSLSFLVIVFVYPNWVADAFNEKVNLKHLKTFC